jgi:hypothetical protein
MNNWQNEYMAEHHRQQLLEEAEHNRLEKLALEARGSCPSLFERIVFKLADRLISRGGTLRKRYEARTVDCGNSARVVSKLWIKC